MDGEIRTGFAPAGWLRGRHAQTVWGRLARSKRQVAMRREALTAPDGDTLLVDHLDAPAAEDAPFLLVLHGLEGSSNSVYAQGILGLAARAGLRAAVLNFRFCARDPLDLHRCIPNERPRLYHSGETSDFDFVARTLAARLGRPLLVAGVSLGGNVLLKWLGENAGDPTVAAAATLSAPFDLAAGARYMTPFPSNLYVRTFVKSLTAKAENLAQRFPEVAGRIDLARARRAFTFPEFDDAATAPLHGFTSADDYYARSSSLPLLARITVPTLCISALDDPFVPPDSVVRARAAASSAVRFVATPNGGHVGFVAANGLSPTYWAEELVVGFLAPEARLEKGA
ncbi:MAG TPA: alpha/beta fold hydrolase [Thermoanaerobaculia bacterium]|nr:alpha/beta fold hydrolase [Thermoanaerobaculia bacterium]